MSATVMYGAGDVRVENVPDARLIEPTDALVRVNKYHHYAASIVGHIVSPKARSATIKLVPRAAGA